jgi:hypothetical protein
MFAVTALLGSFRNCLKQPQNAGAEGNYRLPISDSLMHIKFLLILVPLMPNLSLAVVVLLVRFSISQMGGNKYDGRDNSLCIRSDGQQQFRIGRTQSHRIPRS